MADETSTVEAPYSYLLPADRQPDYPFAVDVDDTQDLPYLSPQNVLEKEELVEPPPSNTPVSPPKPPLQPQPDQSKGKTGKGIGDGRGGGKESWQRG